MDPRDPLEGRTIYLTIRSGRYVTSGIQIRNDQVPDFCASGVYICRMEYGGNKFRRRGCQ
jgi:hypothetical protein